MLIGPLLVSSSLRLAVHGSAMVRRQRQKSCGKTRDITRRTRSVTQTLVGLSIGMACTPIRYTPPRGENERRNPHTPQDNQERPSIVAGLKENT